MAFSQGLAASVALHVAVMASCLSAGTFTRPELQSTSSGASVFSITLSRLNESTASSTPVEAAPPSPKIEVKTPKESVAPSKTATRKPAPISLAKVLRQPEELAQKSPDPVAPSVAATAADSQENTSQAEGRAALRLVSSSSPSVGTSVGAGTPGSGPTLLRSPKPIYPSLARRANFEGRVLLDVLVDESGDVTEAQIAKSSGREDCDQSARETVLARWKFKPAQFNGVSIPWRERVAVSYQLR
jgi:protein TonB